MSKWEPELDALLDCVSCDSGGLGFDRDKAGGVLDGIEAGTIAHAEAYLRALAEASDDGAAVFALCEAADAISRREHLKALPGELGVR